MQVSWPYYPILTGKRRSVGGHCYPIANEKNVGGHYCPIAIGTDKSVSFPYYPILDGKRQSVGGQGYLIANEEKHCWQALLPHS